MLPFLATEIFVADGTHDVFGALDLMDKERLIIFEVLVADSAILVVYRVSLVTFELRLRFEMSMTVRKGARNEVGHVCRSHAVVALKAPFDLSEFKL